MAENPKYSIYQVGEGTYGYPEINFYDAGAKLKIGKHCSFAPKVTILLGGEHHHDWVSSYPFSLMQDEAADLPGYPMTKGDVTIGNDVWIGYDALILSGVTIGDGAVVAARSLVVKDVEPYSIVGGVPAKHLRFRFDQERVNQLMQIKWWDWNASEINAAIPKLQSPDVQAFLDHCKQKDGRS